MNRMESALLLAALAFLAPRLRAAPADMGSPVFKKVFHIVGVPGALRDGRMDLTLTAVSLVAEDRDTRLSFTVPYQNIRRVRLLPGERRYPGLTYAAAIATQSFGGVGSLLILVKRKVDTLVVEYVNQRGGEMGVVFQLPRLEGVRCRRLLETYGIQVEEPDPAPAPAPAEE
jgi:hypothetical protein